MSIRTSILLVLGFAACVYVITGPRGVPDGAEGRVLIDYWEKWTGHEGEVMQEVVDRFNRSQDEIFVRYLPTSSIAEKAMVAIAGGDPPDVLGLWSQNLPFYADNSALLDLSPWFADHSIDIEDYALAIQPLLLWNGTQWAVPNTCGSTALYYDRTAFAQAGLDPDAPPTTIEELNACIDALTILDSDGHVVRAGFLPVEPGWWPWCWGYHFGGSLVDSDGEVTLATAANTEAWQWVQSFPDRWGIDHLARLRSTFGNYNSPEQSFLSGTVAMIMQGPWLANVINAYEPDLDYGVAPFPSLATLGSDLRGVVECDLLVVPRGANHPEEAMAFIAFTQQQDQVEFLCAAHAKPSPLARSSESFREDHPNRGIAVHEAILRSPSAYSAPTLTVWPEYADEINNALQRAWLLESSAAEAIADAHARAAAAVARAKETQRRRRAAANGGDGP